MEYIRPIIDFSISPLPKGVFLLGDASPEIEDTEIIQRSPFGIVQLWVVKENVELGDSELHRGGEIYLLDPSSAILGSLSFLAGAKVESMIDLCASPGGKSIINWKYFGPMEHVANEIEKSRLGALYSNFKRCHLSDTRIVSKSPRVLFEELEQKFDLVLVDAPCSGQSMLLKGIKVEGAFNKYAINGCQKRQRGILKWAKEFVNPGGFLQYTTCTFAVEENQQNVKWILKKNPDLEIVKIPCLAEFDTGEGYLLPPSRELGAGGFGALFRKT